MLPLNRFGFPFLITALLAFVLSLSLFGSAVQAQTKVTALQQAIAVAAANDKDVAAYYRANGYQQIWTSKAGKDRARRSALLAALAKAGDHGLPMSRYQPTALKAAMGSARTAAEVGKLEVQMSKIFLSYARDVQTGMIVPGQVDKLMARRIPYRDRIALLDALVKSSASAFMRSLPPKTPEYTRLMKEKLRLERLLGKGGWGQKVPGSGLKPGQSGNAVVILRNRLVTMGYLRRSASKSFDANLQKAVQLFQQDHGLTPDGVAGKSTIVEVNKSVESRMQSVIVAMERERWLNRPRGKRHVLVNLTDFTVKIIDNEKVTFQSRVVIGKNQRDRQSPEFSDVMEHMIINPTWNVPRSIATKEYLPMLQRNPNAVSHLRMVDARGRTVSRANIDFTQYSAKTFPFNLKQPPSRGNALGLVKFMFPNKHNIYLHDTPAKNLFSREVRAYSHGCIRVHRPFDFAYALLKAQEGDPMSYFQSRLKTGSETQVNLKKPLPVHLVYRTAFTQPKGRTNFRRDVYGRDARLWNELAKAGVALRAVRG